MKQAGSWYKSVT